jgi:spore germination cell wall hydrolase CwlJ-like protein
MRLISDDALAAATIWQEAAGEPYEGKLAVASVIRNRMKRKYQSDGTVAGTVLKDYQFSGWNTDPKDTLRERSMMLDDDNPVVRECVRAWKESVYDDVTNGAVLYFAPKGVKKTPAWAEAPSVKFVKAIHNHHFYQDVTA